MKEILEKSKKLMYDQTQKNGAPCWENTKIAIEKGSELAKKHNVDEDLVLISLYLAHIEFSPIWKGDIQKNHPELSAVSAEKYLDEWNVSIDDKKIILNAIRAHHDKVEGETKIAEIVKNAECFKFVTVKGSLALLHEFGRRGESFELSVQRVLEKMDQKMALLTLEDCVEDAKKNIVEIKKIFDVV